ncbi:MAG TPA: arsenic resistance N-acetyltransferase ArsN2 [Gemmatimonadales bacterium]|nr:arsenic resistance N-acetyltransferase ArsN2 [Gemmatimonadales bacterium]
MLLNRGEGGARLPAGLRPATPADRDAVLGLLTDAGLPVAGIGPDLVGFVVASRGTEVVGAGGLELAGGDALLRSLVVRADERGNGTGLALISRLLSDARRRGVASIWLLTETAAPLFARFGFRARARADAPEAIRATAEFASCCPSSAVAMSRRATPLRVLVLCTGNTARSQIAEALLGHTLGDQVVAASAGTSPGNGPHPLAVAVLAERGIEWAERRSKSVDEVPGPWDLVITVCDGARESCPVLPGARMIHWGLPDPAGQGVEAFRAVADELERRIGDVL